MSKKNQFKRYLHPLSHPTYASAALLLIRLIMGYAFILHGQGKIQNPMGWAGADSSYPAFFQLLAAIAEFGGGIAILLGLVTPLAALGILSTMSVALYMHVITAGHSFVSKGGPAFELPLLYWALSLLFLAMGPGKFSLDFKLFGSRK